MNDIDYGFKLLLKPFNDLFMEMFFMTNTRVIARDKAPDFYLTFHFGSHVTQRT